MIRDYVYPGPPHLFGADCLPKQISDAEIFANLGDHECLGCSANCPVWTEDHLPLKICFLRSATQWDMNHPGGTYKDFLEKALVWLLEKRGC